MQPLKTKLYLITDRKLLTPDLENSKLEKSLENLLEFCLKASESGIDIIQIREKDLSAKDLSDFVSRLTSKVKTTQVLVNDRLDIALSCGASGVHLPSNSFPVKDVRKFVGENFLISVSAHSIQEAKEAEEQGANLILLSPIFDTPSKKAYGKPLGVEMLKQVTTLINTPIIALGGINKENAHLALESGAKGLAAIRLFIENSDLRELADDLKK